MEPPCITLGEYNRLRILYCSRRYKDQGNVETLDESERAQRLLEMICAAGKARCALKTRAKPLQKGLGSGVDAKGLVEGSDEDNKLWDGILEYGV